MKNTKQNVIIIGSRGYGKNYGGWETFVKNLIDNWKENTTQFHVFEVTHEKNKDTIIEHNNEALCPQVYIRNIGSAMMMLFCAKALFRVIRYVKDSNLKNIVLYILGVRIGPLFMLMRRKLNKMNISVIINPDGLEWTRARWNRLVKWYLLVSEAMMLKSSDCIVCDSMVIAKYIKKKYKKLKSLVRFISYGVCVEEDATAINETTQTFFDKFKITPRQYFLIVARFVPENNFLLIMKEFIHTKTRKDLVIISNVEKNAFYYSLKESTGFDKDKRIKLVGAIYDRELLKTIRKQAFAYLHGHMVGGTNPGLLEAMGTTKLNILYDIDFNREVGKEAVLYFNETPDSLAQIINILENITCEEAESYSRKAKQRVMVDYAWDKVVLRYEALFDEILNNMQIKNRVAHNSVNMKIAITTILSKNNYGAVLQGYSLYKFLSDLGNEVVMIDYSPKENNSWLRWLFHSVFIWYLRKRRKKLQKFIEHNVTLTPKKYNSYRQLCKQPPRADIYVVGSDQVWTDRIFRGGVNYGFLLGFVTNKKKISYASSIGKAKISDDHLKKIVYYIQDFQHISVREQSAKELLKKAGLNNIHVVLDPVFLLNREQYREIAIPFKAPYKYLLIYAFERNETLNMVAKNLALAIGLKIVEIGGAFQKYASDLFHVDFGVEEFLGVLMGAEYIVTSSFHGTALSIILQKQFFSGLPNKSSDRITNLLNIFGLEDRIITDQTDYDTYAAIKPINYSHIDKLRMIAIKLSSEYILKSLNDNYKGVGNEN